MLAVGLLVRLPSLNAPLLAISSLRQTETAYPALIYHQQGINLLFPQLPVLGKPWQVPFEFPLFQAMAAVLMNLGGAADWAMRVSSVIRFVATAVAVWGLVRHLSTRTAAGIAVLVVLASPFNVWWSRASMIEYMATAFSVGYVWAGMIWIDNRQRRFAPRSVLPRRACGAPALGVVRRYQPSPLPARRDLCKCRRRRRGGRGAVIPAGGRRCLAHHRHANAALQRIDDGHRGDEGSHAQLQFATPTQAITLAVNGRWIPAARRARRAHPG